MSLLTIITYHYVRDLSASQFPHLAALDAARFEHQLDHLAARYRIVCMSDVLGALNGECLPDNACLLTFDDGYRDHADVVAPALARRGWTGVFFPAANAVARRQMLDVNKIQFVIAASGEPITLARELAELVEAYRDKSTPCLDTLYSKWRRPGRWDNADTRFVKGVLQQGLSADLRQRLTDMLFRRHVSDDPKGFADALYLDRRDMANMMDAGMTFGSHGTRHERLCLLGDDALQADLAASLDFLSSCGVDVKSGWSLCYPHGAHDRRVREAASKLGCRFAVTVESRVANLAVDDPLTMPRLDTNDLPS